MNEPKIFSPEWWLEYELAKVQDEDRRRFLKEVFAGSSGWRKFLNIRATGKGAKECEEAGAWKTKKTNKRDLSSKKRPCLVCGFHLIKFTPWNELFEDHLPICMGCIRELLNTTIDETPQAIFAEQLKSIIQNKIYREDRIGTFRLVQLDLRCQRDKLRERLASINKALKPYGL